MIADLLATTRTKCKARAKVYGFFTLALPWLVDHWPGLGSSGLIPKLVGDLQNDVLCHDAFRALHLVVDKPGIVTPELLGRLFAYATSHLNPKCPVLIEIIQFFWCGLVASLPEFSSYILANLGHFQSLASTSEGVSCDSLILRAVTVSLDRLDDNQLAALIPVVQMAMTSWPTICPSSDHADIDMAKGGASDLLVLAGSRIRDSLAINIGIALTKFFSLPICWRQRLEIEDESLNRLRQMYLALFQGGFSIEQHFPEFVEASGQETILGSRIAQIVGGS
jgi:hypothetical protein